MSETSMKKLLTILSIRSRRYWQRLQALSLSREADQSPRRRQQRRRGRQALGLDVLAYQPQTVSASQRQRPVRFWVPFSIVATTLLLYPISPILHYSLTTAQADEPSRQAEAQSLVDYERSLDEMINGDAAWLPVADLKADDVDFTPRLTIKKIGVDTEIVEGNNAHAALEQGVWRMPVGSTPDRGGNTVLTAHRYKFLPPSDKTFYLLDKLEKGDEVVIQWQGKQFTYRGTETKVGRPKAGEILPNTDVPQLTLFTCTPLFSSKNRLVVIAALIDVR